MRKKTRPGRTILILGIIFSILLSLFSLCYVLITNFSIPDEGVWYCESLQFQICFCGSKTCKQNYQIIDGERITRITKWLHSSDYRIFEDHPDVWDYDLEDQHLLDTWDFVVTYGNKVVFRDVDTGEKYIFVRVE